MGFLRLGSYVKFMPYPVTVGFTAGIGVIIFASQVKDFFGLTLGAAEPGALLPKLAALATAAPTVNAAAVAMSVLTVGMILGLRRFWPRAPGMLLGVGLAALLVAAFQLPVETIGTRFGGIPHGLPMPALPPITLEKMIAVLPDAIAFAVLGAIEALLSAVVADGMTGRRHRSNCELVGQGVANIASGLFGGICATGTIARTATNVRSGAHGPIAGILHALFILGFMLVAAPLASYIPLAALAGVLTVVAWNMIERHAIAILARTSLGDSAVLAVTFLLTIFRDLSEGIVVGFGLGTLLFLHRMTQATRIELHLPDILEDKADSSNGGRTQYDSTMATNRDVMVYRLNGAFFFGTASTLGAILERIADSPKTFILDFAAVPFLDSTGANIIVGLAKNAQRSDTKLVISGASTATRTMLEGHDPQGTQLTFADSIAEALTRWAPRPA